MAKEDDLNENNELVSSNSSDLNNSIVNKVKSLIPTTLSKWFGKSPSVSRRRDSDSDDESFILEQPPTKRVKLPDNELNESTNLNSSNILNGSLNKYQPQNTDLQLNNIRPRQSFRQTTYYTKPEVSSQINFSRDKSSLDDDIAIPGPSGLQTNQLVNNATDRILLTPSKTPEKLNGEKKTDSGGSTSGCSSMAHKHTQTLADKPPLITPPSENDVNTDNCSISSKRTQSSNKFIDKNITNNLTLGNLSTSTRSLFSDRSYSPRLNSSLSSRRPSFNSSSFGSSSLIDNTLTTERISNSPFYAGRTMFGGAAAYRRQKDSSTPPARNSPIQIKPTNESVMKNNNSASMSQTARRILDALEHFNTPIGDARKIPRLNISSKKLQKKGEERKRTPYSRDETPKSRIPTKELTIPTIPDILQIQRRDKFVVRKNDTRNVLQSHNNTNNNSTPLPPPISLPITTLPKFELMAQPPPPSGVGTNYTKQNVEEKKLSKPFTIKNTISKILTDSHTFKFAPPKAIDAQTTIDTCAKTLRSINNFKFSQPTNVKDTTIDSNENFKYPSTENYVLKTRKPINDNYLKDSKTKQDDQSLDKFKPSSNTWECDSCMIRNQLDATKCIACGVQRVQTNTTSKIERKTTADNKWECNTCLVRNNNADERCVACTALKPGASQTQTTQSSGFGVKFKASTDTWECTTCLVRNKNDQSKCVACTTQKPSETPKNTFGTAFTKKVNEWECPSCMVRNPDGKLTCACCEAPKPGQKTTQIKSIVLPTSTPFKFGIDQADVKTTTTSSSTPSSGFVFGNTEKKDVGLKKSDEWECSACMVRNTNDKLSCVCCETPKSGGLPSQKGGITLPTSTPFKFGIDKVDSSAATSNVKTPGFTFGLKSTSPQTASTESKPEFSFGIKPDSKTSDSDNNQMNSVKSNEFGLFKANSSVTCSSATTITVNFAKNSTVTFGSTHSSPNTENKSSSGFTTETTSSYGNSSIPTFGKSPNSSFGNVSKPNATFGSVTNVTTSTLSFGLKATTTSSTTPSFGNSATSSTSAGNSNSTSTSLTFGTTNVTSPAFGSTTTVTSPVFGNMKTVTSTTFGNTTTATSLTFGNTPSATSSTFGNTSTSTSSAFGNQTGSSLAFGNTTTTSSAFGNTTTTAPPAFSNTSTASSAFGNATTTPSTGFVNTTTTASIGFGNTTTTTSLTFGNTSTITSPAFGNTSATPTFGSTASTTIPTFGNNSLPSSTFTFGDKLPENKPAAVAFTFGSTESSATAAKVPAFSFNSGNTPNFGTGFNSNDTSSKPIVPTFGSNLSNTSNTFGVASQQSTVQNIPTNPSFGAAAPVFGSSTNATSTPAFQFGATANQPQAPVFSFGTSNQAQTNQFGKGTTANNFGGFGSSQQTAPAAPSIPTFNPNTKPVFNFTSGSAPSFTAQPPSGTSSLQQPGVNPQRRIKKAVRRRGGVP
ncbi:nuclear pore complex protein Nup153-like isoform X2 [Chrysoperla carnea]|uniref:nuclear pore complex protein Nup153-like isoform X2 n=1 Tax=Chrysoperla carnea TaxID=189513 RepID=UPI001D066EC8|nr:nuclear pore complex protein Nup153-like isoform X2 [Chrysoperla carnea]